MKKKFKDILNLIIPWLKWAAVPFIFILSVLFMNKKGADPISPMVDEEEKKSKDKEKRIKEIEEKVEKRYTDDQAKITKNIAKVKKKRKKNAEKGKQITKENKEKDKKIKESKNFSDLGDEFDDAF